MVGCKTRYHWESQRNHRHKNGFILIANFYEWKKFLWFSRSTATFYVGNFQTRWGNSATLYRDETHLNCECRLRFPCLINFSPLSLFPACHFQALLPNETWRECETLNEKPKHKSQFMKLIHNRLKIFSFRITFQMNCTRPNSGCSMQWNTYHAPKPYECSLKLRSTVIDSISEFITIDAKAQKEVANDFVETFNVVWGRKRDRRTKATLKPSVGFINFW